MGFGENGVIVMSVQTVLVLLGSNCLMLTSVRECCHMRLLDNVEKAVCVNLLDCVLNSVWEMLSAFPN